MEYISDRREAFDATLNLAFSLAQPKSICGSLIVGPWYTDFLVDSPYTGNIEQLHVFEYDIYEALAQMGPDGPYGVDPRFRSKTAYFRSWSEIADKVAFDSYLHFGDIHGWQGSYAGDIARFWEELSPKDMKEGRIVLILDTCSVRTLDNFLSRLRQVFPEKLQPGAVVMTNAGITRCGYDKAEKTETRVMQALTNQPYARKWSCTYNSKNKDGYRGHRRKLSVFTVE